MDIVGWIDGWMQGTMDRVSLCTFLYMCGPCFFRVRCGLDFRRWEIAARRRLRWYILLLLLPLLRFEQFAFEISLEVLLYSIFSIFGYLYRMYDDAICKPAQWVGILTKAAKGSGRAIDPKLKVISHLIFASSGDAVSWKKRTHCPIRSILIIWKPVRY